MQLTQGRSAQSSQKDLSTVDNDQKIDENLVTIFCWICFYSEAFQSNISHVFMCFTAIKTFFFYIYKNKTKNPQDLFAYLAPHHKQSSVLFPSFSPE